MNDDCYIIPRNNGFSLINPDQEDLLNEFGFHKIISTSDNVDNEDDLNLRKSGKRFKRFIKFSASTGTNKFQIIIFQISFNFRGFIFDSFFKFQHITINSLLKGIKFNFYY